MLSLPIPLGIYDNPDKQEQMDYKLDLYNNNLAIFGSSMSGKTVLLKTIILHIHKFLGLSEKEEIYILDFDNALRLYGTLPYVNGYFNGSNDENVRRTFKILDDKLSENSKKLAGSIYSEINDESKRPSHITFILDGYSKFISEERYYNYHEILKKIARDGLSKGITVIITSSDTKGFTKVSSYFKRKIAFDLPKDSYSELYSNKVTKPLSIAGRGVVNDEKGTYEFQAYLARDESNVSITEEDVLKILRRKTILSGLFYDENILNSDESDDEIFKDLLQSDNKKIYETLKGKKIKILPEENLTKENWYEYCNCSISTLNEKFVAGLDYYSLEPLPLFDVKDLQSIAIYGKKEFGKSNLLKLLIENASLTRNVQFCFWEDKRNSLTKPIGLKKTIDDLINKEFVYNKDQFLNYLSEKQIIKDIGKINASSTEEMQPSTSVITNENSSEKENDISYNYDDWLDEYRDSVAEERRHIYMYGTDEDREEFDRNYQKIIEEKKLEFEKEKVYTSEISENECLDEIEAEEACKISYDQDDCLQEQFTVFVIQSRLFYQEYDEYKNENIANLVSSIIEDNVSSVLFIFSDVQVINNRKFQVEFNNMIKHAFLLDDIVRFVSNKGQNSVFGHQDIKELKENFGLCEIGDGFYYDIEGDYITKLKFIHSFPNTNLEEDLDVKV